ncbi:MAG: META domain-containing protein [Sandarakinorhabdus sp.]|nr:META domain-containing protein [Sandarakinorhabdus sp.]
MKTSIITLAAVLALAGCTSPTKTADSKLPPLGGSLEGGPWLVESINGTAINPKVRADLTFEPGDHDTSMVFGTGGCNRLRGGWQQTGSKIKLGPMAGTMMMCEPEKMETEQKVLKGLEAATTVSFGADGAAMLTAADGGVVKLRREKK